MKSILRYILLFFLLLVGIGYASAESYTFSAGTTIVFDFSAVKGNGGVNYYDANGTWVYKDGGAGNVYETTLTTDWTIQTDNLLFKTAKSNWSDDPKFTLPGSNVSYYVVKVGSDGKSYTWQAYYTIFAYTGTEHAWLHLGVNGSYGFKEMIPVDDCPGQFYWRVETDKTLAWIQFFGDDVMTTIDYDTKDNASLKWDNSDNPLNVASPGISADVYVSVADYHVIDKAGMYSICEAANKPTGDGQDCGYTDATEGVYYVTGDGWCGTRWTLTEVNGTQLDYKGNGLYEKTFENVPAGKHLFKISNGTWSSVNSSTGKEWGAKEINVCDGNVVTCSDDSQYDNISFTLASARDVTVHFCYNGTNGIPTVCVTYPLVVTYSAETGGAASANCGASGSAVDYATTVEFTATPSSGYTFLGWYDENGSQVSTSAKYTDIILEDYELTARFMASTDVNHTDAVSVYKNATIDLSAFVQSLSGPLTWTLTKDPQAYQYSSNPDGSEVIPPFSTEVDHTVTLTQDGHFSADWEGIYEVSVNDGTNSNVFTVYVYTIMFKHPWCDGDGEGSWRWHEVAYDESKDQIYFQESIGNYKEHGINIIFNYYGGLDEVEDKSYFFKVYKENVFYQYDACKETPGCTTVQLLGSFTNWESSPISFSKQSNGLWTCPVTLTGNTDYQFKFKLDGTWTGRDNTNSVADLTWLSLTKGSGGDIRFKTGTAGEYTFVFDEYNFMIVYPGSTIPESGSGSGGSSSSDEHTANSISDECSALEQCTYTQFLYYPAGDLVVTDYNTLKGGYIVVSALPNIQLASSLGETFNYGRTTSLSATPDNVPAGYRPDYTLTVTDDKGNVVLPTVNAKGASNTATVSTNWTPSRPGTYTYTATMTFEGVTYDASMEIVVTPPPYYLNTSANGTWMQLTYIPEDNVYHLVTNLMPYNGTEAHISINQSSVYETYGYTSGTLQVSNPDNLTPAATTYCMWIYDPDAQTLTVRGQVYRVKSVSQYGTFYSNSVNTTTAPISFFADPAGECYLMAYDLRSLKWLEYDINIESGKLGAGAESGVYHTNFTDFDETKSNITGTWTLYTGDYYIYSANTVTKYNAGAMGDAQMTAFTPGGSAQEYFNHYWVSDFANGTDAGACVGDNVNMCLSDTIFSTVLNSGAAIVRYAYNDHNNIFDLAAIHQPSASTLNYLKGYGANTEAADLAAGVTFRSVGDDYRYEVDITARANSSIVLGGAYGDKVRYPFCPADRNSSVTNSADITYPLIGAVLVNGGANASEAFNMRVEYDFKTNAVLAGWAPDQYKATNASATLSVDANLFIIRKGQTAPEVIANAQTGEITIPAGRQTYLFMEVDKTAVTSAYGLSGKYYYMALPFAASIADMYGLGTYKTNWIVQRYRGDTRAQNGYSGSTFWRNLTATASLTQGRGYVFGIVPPSYDRVVDYAQSKSEDRARIYIPRSGTSAFRIVQPSQYADSTLTQYTCAVESKVNDDSNWHVVGIPGLIGVSGSTTFRVIDGYVGVDKATAPNYVYTWNGDYDGFEVHSTSDFVFEPTRSYFVQYYGSIKWNTASKAGVAARQQAQGNNSRISLGLYDYTDECLDHTYVSYTQDGSTDYDMTRDLVKMSTNHSQLSTVFEGAKLAALDLPTSYAENIPLEVIVAESGAITFRLEETSVMSAGVEVWLYDSEASTYTNLLEDDYTTLLAAGTYSERFYLRYLTDNVVSAPTDLKNASSEICVFTHDGRIYVEGDALHTTVYDVTGRLVGYGQSEISVPNGIYVVEHNGTTTKVVVR